MHNIQRFSYYGLSFSHQTKCKPIITVVSVVTIYIYRPIYVSFMYMFFDLNQNKYIYSSFKYIFLPIWNCTNWVIVGIIIRIMRINNIVF